MINRVGGQASLPPQRVIEPGPRVGSGSVTAASPVARITPRADVSSLPADVSKLAASPPPVDAAKVASLKAGIAAGTYKADPVKIADRMVETDFAPRAYK